MGKSNGKKWSQIWTFLFGSGLKLQNKTKIVFLADFALQNMVETTIRDLWSKGISLILAYFSMFLSFCVLDDFFLFSKKLGFWVFLVHPTVVSVLLSASVERCFVSCIRDFYRMKAFAQALGSGWGSEYKSRGGGGGGGKNSIQLLIHWFSQSSFSSQSSRHHKHQTVRARELTFWDNVHHPLCVTCHLSHVTCDVSQVKKLIKN